MALRVGGARWQMNGQRKGDHSYHNQQHREGNANNGWTCNGHHRGSDLYHRMAIKMAFYGPLVLANQYGISRHVLDKKPTVFLFDLYKWKSSQTNEWKIILDCNERESQPIKQFPDLGQFADPDPLNEGMARLPWGRNLIKCQRVLLFTLSPAIPPRGTQTSHKGWEAERKQWEFPGSLGYWFWIDWWWEIPRNIVAFQFK